MKGILIGIAVFVAICSAADAQSFGYLMKRADLVVAGRMVEETGSARVQMFSLDGIELIKGDLQDDRFRVVRFRDIGCQVPLFPGERNLLFLKRLSDRIDGLHYSGPAYAVLAGELGKYGLAEGEEGAVLEAVRRYAAAEVLDRDERAAVVAGIYRAALDEECEAVLYSALYDLVSTPGALARMTREDGTGALERFKRERPASRLRRRLLFFMGEMLPPGLTEALEPLVRSKEGCFYRDTLAAILARTGDPGTPQRLAADFASLDAVTQFNVVHVLGGLGKGKGVAALRTLASENLDTHHAPIIEALQADRTDRAADVLAEIAATGHRKASDGALNALVRINTPAARHHLSRLSASNDVMKRIRDRASELLDLLK